MLWILLAMLFALPFQAFATALPPAVAKAVASNADKYVDGVSVLVDGFGTAGAIDRQGLQNAVALARAEARAVALRRLQGADLDGDGAIAAPELQVAAAAAAAMARGRLMLYFRQADTDGDGLVSAMELQGYAEGEALKAYGEDKAQALFAVLGFDGNGDGRVTVAEVRVAISALASEQGDSRKIQNEFKVQNRNQNGDRPGDQNQPFGRDQSAHLLPVSGE